jgi:hypothetical protein
LRQFAEWLSTTGLSVFIQHHNGWMIPTIQSIHIVGISLVLGSVLMIDLRVLGWAGTDQTLRQTTNRFGPWLVGALVLQLVTGLLMVVGEPVRELINFSFWLKMLLISIGTSVAILFLATISKRQEAWDETLVRGSPVKWMAVVTFLIWLGIIILGRLIAYDHVWGSWSPAPKA